MRGIAVLPAAVAMMTSGCGTLVPGPRYRATVDDFAFGYDGRDVFYLEGHSRFHVLLRRYRDYHDLWLYDTASRRHRLIARTDAFSVSPRGPCVLYAPRASARFRHRDRTPDFLLLDYRSGERRGFRMPGGFDESYLSYGLPLVEWNEDGSLTAFVSFRYAPGATPKEWRRQFEKPPRWTTSLWEVSIDPEAGPGVAGAAPVESDDMPEVSWSDIRTRKRVSPGGRRELTFSKYRNYLDFSSTLTLVERGGGDAQYIVREHTLIGLVQAGKYVVVTFFGAPLNLVDHLPELFIPHARDE